MRNIIVICCIVLLCSCKESTNTLSDISINDVQEIEIYSTKFQSDSKVYLLKLKLEDNKVIYDFDDRRDEQATFVQQLDFYDRKGEIELTQTDLDELYNNLLNLEKKSDKRDNLYELSVLIKSSKKSFQINTLDLMKLKDFIYFIQSTLLENEISILLLRN
jgi:hypothetical protein